MKQAEFSKLNTNYLYALVTCDGRDIFRVFNLTANGLTVEIEFQLESKPEKKLNFASQSVATENFVSFTQNANSTSDDSFLSLDVF